MTIAESRFMESVPHQLREIKDALTLVSRPRLVKVGSFEYINPRYVIGIYDCGKNINIAVVNGDCTKTITSNFKTLAEAATALGYELTT